MQRPAWHNIKLPNGTWVYLPAIFDANKGLGTSTLVPFGGVFLTSSKAWDAAAKYLGLHKPWWRIW